MVAARRFGWVHIGLICVALTLLSSGALTLAQGQTPVTIQFMHGWDGERAPLIDEVIRRFEERYPWITVEQRVVSPTSLTEQLTVSVAGNAAPDVAMIPFNNSVVFGRMGGLLELNPMVEADGIRLEEMFYPPVLNALVNTHLAGGKFYYLPTLIDTSWYLFYNKDHFAESGLDVRNVPTTWSQLEDTARRLNRTGPDGQLVRLGMDVSMTTYSQPFEQWMMAAGGRWYSDDLRRVIAGEPEGKGLETLQWIADFTAEVSHGIAQLEGVNKWARSGFYAGTHSMLLQGVWTWYQIHENSPGLDFGIAEIPHRDGVDFRPPLTLGWGYGIPSNARHPEAAWLLLKFLTLDVDGGGYLVLAQGRPGATIEINQQPEYHDVNPYWSVIQNSLNRSVPGEFEPPIAILGRLRQTMINNVVRGYTSPAAAMEQLSRHLQNELNAFWNEMER